MNDIPGYEGLYAATKSGQIWAYPKLGYSNAGRWKKGRFLKHWLIQDGYKVVSLYKDKKSKGFLIHRLIALAHIPNPEKLAEINHKNGNTGDNRIENLEWVSSKQNKAYAWKLGLYEKNRGQNHYLTTLIPKQVIQIRKLCEQNKITQREIADTFSVCQMTISNIKRRITWKHIS